MRLQTGDMNLEREKTVIKACNLLCSSLLPKCLFVFCHESVLSCLASLCSAGNFKAAVGPRKGDGEGILSSQKGTEEFLVNT